MKQALNALKKLSDGIAITANAVGTLVVLVLVMVVNYDMGARNLLMVLIVFLQLPDVARVGRLTRSDGFLLVIGGNYPVLEKWLRRLINLISAVFMTLVAYAIFPEFLKMWESNDFFGVPGVFTAPWWPIKLTILASAILTAVIFGLKVLGAASDRGQDT